MDTIFFSLGGVQGAQHPLVKIWDTVYISETIRAGKLKFYIHLGRVKYSFGV